MLNLWRRHTEPCLARLKKAGIKEFRSHKKCGCPIWVQGSLHGKRVKKTLSLRNWEAAQKLVRDWESGNTVGTKNVSEACDAFLEDCEARGLAGETTSKYRLLTKELKSEFGSHSVGSVGIEDLRGWRGGWKLGPMTSRKKLERLRTFFRFCQEAGWIAGNPAKILKAPVGKQSPTLPFTTSEMERILWAVELFPNRGIHGKNTQPRLRAFINVLRYSGLRIRDVTTLTREKIKDGKILLYSQKTGVPVFLPLPKHVISDLEKCDQGTRYFFWTGQSSPRSGVSVWQRSLRKLFKLANVENGHAHRFRDTFSVELLEKGVPLETVAVLLGNSVRICERHYSPWVKSRQENLETQIEKIWK